MLFVSTVKEIKTKVYLKLQFKEFNTTVTQKNHNQKLSNAFALLSVRNNMNYILYLLHNKSYQVKQDFYTSRLDIWKKQIRFFIEFPKCHISFNIYDSRGHFDYFFFHTMQYLMSNIKKISTLPTTLYVQYFKTI